MPDSAKLSNYLKFLICMGRKISPQGIGKKLFYKNYDDSRFDLASTQVIYATMVLTVRTKSGPRVSTQGVNSFVTCINSFVKFYNRHLIVRPTFCTR